MEVEGTLVHGGQRHARINNFLQMSLIIVSHPNGFGFAALKDFHHGAPCAEAALLLVELGRFVVAVRVLAETDIKEK